MTASSAAAAPQRRRGHRGEQPSHRGLEKRMTRIEVKNTKRFNEKERTATEKKYLGLKPEWRAALSLWFF